MNDATEKKPGLFNRSKKPKEPKPRPEIPLTPWNSWQVWVNVALVWFTLQIAALSIDQAHWISPQPSLTVVLIITVLLTFIFSRLRIPGALKVVIMVVAGLLLTLWQTINCLEPSETTSGFAHLMNIFQGYFQGSASLQVNEQRIIYVVFITFITWFIAYISTWFVLRKNNAWVAVVLGALMLLFNLGNLPDSYYYYFIFYFFAAALLVAVTRMSTQSFGLTQTSSYSMGGLVYLGVSLLCITLLAASVSWLTPQIRASALQNFVATSMPWQNDLMDSKLNIFNVVPSKQEFATSSVLKDLNYGETWNQGDDIKYVVLSQHPSYWQMYVYDTYSSGEGWTSSSANKTLQDAAVPWQGNEGYLKQEQMKYAVVNNIRTDILFTNGGFIKTDIPVWLNFDAGGEIVSINAPRVLDPGEGYTVTSYISNATADDLANADTSYPDYILNTYLQLPDNLPADISLLSGNITANSNTPYTKVKAVIGYLAQYRYTLKVDPTPEGMDNIEYFLFTGKKGFCLHYASAAVVMLRSAGVPARLAIGYLPGEAGNTPGEYIVRDKSYHAWPQVYFPNYGWVDIEATPSAGSNVVALDSPLVISSMLEGMPDWQLWMGMQPPDALTSGHVNLPDLLKGSSGGSSSFPAELGRILAIIFGGILVVGLLVGAIVVLRSLSFRWIWRVNRDTLSYDTYINMVRLAATVGVIPRPQQTPLEYTAELAAVIPQETPEINIITRYYLDSRFGGRDTKPGMADEALLLKSRHKVYRALIQRFGRVKRLFIFGKR